ncbi:MAG: DHH family phosphoesterase [Candidatus Hydrogenedentota bacterium]
MASLLKGLGKTNVVCALHDAVPKLYGWMPGASTILSLPEVRGRSFDTFVLVDANHLERAESIVECIGDSTRVIIVDHHLADRFESEIHLIDSRYAATGEILPELFDAADVAIDSDTAVALYVALSTDTGSFRFGNTTPNSHRVASRLIAAGVNVADVTERIFDTMSRAKFMLLSRVLQGVRLSADGRVAAIHITRRDLEETGAQPEDIEGLINYARGLEGVEIAILFRESGNGSIKLSSRARPGFNCAEFMATFGGGGHAAAAGASISGTLDDVEQRVMQALEERLRKQA